MPRHLSSFATVVDSCEVSRPGCHHSITLVQEGALPYRQHTLTAEIDKFVFVHIRKIKRRVLATGR